MSKLALKLIEENKTKYARGEDAKVLDLGNCGLAEGPMEVFDCEWLEELILSNSWSEYDFEFDGWAVQIVKTREMLMRLVCFQDPFLN